MSDIKLDSFLLPLAMPPSLALPVAQELCGLKRQTLLVKYLALTLQHQSWRLGRVASLQEHLQELEGPLYRDPRQALHALTATNTYAVQGLTLKLEPTVAKTAAKAAVDWVQAIESQLSSDEDYEALHLRAREALQAAMLRPVQSQGNQALRLQSLINEHFPQLLNPGHRDGTDAGSESRNSHIHVDAFAQPFEGFSLPGAGQGGPIVRQFNSPQDALHFLLTRALRQRAGDASAPTNEAASQQSNTTEKSSTSPAFAPPQGAHVRLFDPLQAQALLRQQANGPAGQEGNALLKKTLAKMALETGYRPLHTQDSALALDDLRQRFPHFGEVLDYLERHLALSGCGQHGPVVHMPPVLLRGEPGCGKTYFAQELARVLGLHFLERDLSVATDAFVLSGMDSGWKNSKPGLVLEALLHQQNANPLVCLNEVDKVKTIHSGSSPLSALYALLEPTSAAQFVDEFVGIPVNAAKVNWVLTANNEPIPEPILSRLEVFELSMPTQEQTRQIARSVWMSLLQRTLPEGHAFDTVLDNDVLELLQTMSPRLLRKALTYAAAGAVQEGRRHLLADDLLRLPARYQPAYKKSVMGFIG